MGAAVGAGEGLGVLRAKKGGLGGGGGSECLRGESEFVRGWVFLGGGGK
jgi:hypothetical protein